MRPGVKNVLLHDDGEFSTAATLVSETMIGRNYGWLPRERPVAVKHLVHILRDDKGLDALSRDFGGPYARLLAGTDKDIPARFRLPESYRIDVTRASDDAILAAVGKLVGAYLESLEYARDDEGRNTGSPYDEFLWRNGIDRGPRAGETPNTYGDRLLTEVSALPNPVFVKNGTMRRFRLISRICTSVLAELEGLKFFLTRPATTAGRPLGGNCVACHQPPNFTDLSFHNTGATQDEYDGIHGAGAFAALVIPALAERNKNPSAYLSPTFERQAATGRFNALPSIIRPGLTDLGLWNVYMSSPAHTDRDARISLLLFGDRKLTDGEKLDEAVARFKTPSLRDLAMSEPYLHTGAKNTILDVIRFYDEFSAAARVGKVRNADPEMRRIHITSESMAPLEAFLKSLNEDYDN